MKKLFIVIRSDLDLGLQAAQACHALQAMDNFVAWYGDACEVYGP